MIRGDGRCGTAAATRHRGATARQRLPLIRHACCMSVVGWWSW